MNYHRVFWCNHICCFHALRDQGTKVRVSNNQKMKAIYYGLIALFGIANSAPWAGFIVVPSVNHIYELWRRDGNQRLVYLERLLHGLEIEDDQSKTDEDDDDSAQSRLIARARSQSDGIKIRADLTYRPGQN